jgi:glycosyltransferase involved in cell wall biosynthesis
VHIGGQGTIGAIRNVAAQLARGGVIAHWDDDDWYHPKRLSEQLGVIRAGALATGYRSCYFRDFVRSKCYRYEGPVRDALGSSLCYLKTLWQTNRFENFQVGEDVNWVRKVRPYLVTTDGLARMVATTHAGGTSPRHVRTKQWIECDEAELGVLRQPP